MTAQTCWECNNIFHSNSGVLYCNVCLQARKNRQHTGGENRIAQANAERRMWEALRQEVLMNRPPAPTVIYVSQEENRQPSESYVPPTPEEVEKRNRLRKINKVLEFFVYASVPIAWIILWFITSGWVTLATFIAALYLPFILYKQHFYWRVKNSRYLYGI